jgi:hypothetical protein
VQKSQGNSSCLHFLFLVRLKNEIVRQLYVVFGLFSDDDAAVTMNVRVSGFGRGTYIHET